MITTSNYMNGLVYQNDTLQFISHEEGRIRFVKATVSTCTAMPNRFIYDYFIKDHLGNVRSVLTEQKEDICYLPATVEDSRYTTEKTLYDISDSRRIDKATTGATQASFENKLYRVHGGLTNEKTGLGIVLKVMNGDQVKITAESYYTILGTGIGLPVGGPALSELLSAFANSGAVAATHSGITATEIGNAW